MLSGNCQIYCCQKHIFGSCRPDIHFCRRYNGYICSARSGRKQIFFRAHCFDSSYFIKTICIFGVLGLADDLVIDLMFFAFTYMTSFQAYASLYAHVFLAVDGLDGQFSASSVISPWMDSIPLIPCFRIFFRYPVFLYIPHRRCRLFSVDSVFFDQLVEAVCIHTVSDRP